MFDGGEFDIFREFEDGNTAWIAAVRTLQDAEWHMPAMACQKPGKYFVWGDGKQITRVDTTLPATKAVN